MTSKILRVALIISGCIILLLGGLGFWIYYNQATLFTKLKEIVNEKIDGTLEVKDFKFTPFQNGVGFTFSLINVKLKDKYFDQHHTYLVDAASINITLETQSLFRGKVLIHSMKFANGKLNVFKRKDGFSNLSIFSSSHKKDSTATKKTDTGTFKDLEEVTFKDFKVQYADSLKEKFYDADFHQFVSKVDYDAGVWKMETKGDVYFKGLVFNPDRGGFLTNQEVKLNLSTKFHEKDKKLIVGPSEIESATKDKIKISGEFDFSEDNRNIKLNFKTQEIRLASARKLLTEHLSNILGRIKIDPLISAEVQLNGKMGERIPRIDINFDARDFEYRLPVGLLKELSTQGNFTNHADSTKPVGDANTRIIGNNVKGLFETIPINGKIMVNDLEQALAEIECTLNADPSSLNDLLDPERYKVKKGNAQMKLTYKGNIKSFFNKETKKLNGLLYGSVSLKDLAIVYLPQQVKIEQIRGDIAFTGEEVNIPNIQIFDGQNNLYVNGRITGFFPYLYLENSPLKALVNIKIPDWQLNWLKVLLNLDHSRPKRNGNSKFALSTLLDKAIDNIEVDATLEAKRFKYNRLTAQNLRGRMTLSSQKVHLHNFSMNAFGGTFQISGDVNQLRTGRPIQLNVDAKLTNTDVKSVFSSFNNFGQYTMTDRNIQGRLNSTFKFSAELKNDVSLVQNSVDGLLKVDLRDAEIIDFDPFLKMKKLIFRKRPLEHVLFAPIVHEFTIKGKEVEVKKMQIESNVMTFFLDGIYSLGDKTDLNIQIPLSNLRKRDSTYQFRDYDPDSIGSNIFLKAVEENGKMNIKYVMKKKARKLPFRAFR
ncbi:AsmA-like C-terminal region-containing protein [Emticicia fontis]